MSHLLSKSSTRKIKNKKPLRKKKVKMKRKTMAQIWKI
jgi:hypothetical protein